MARRPATLSAYKPTLREQLAILGEKGYTALTGNEPGYEARDLINRYTGLADLLEVPGMALSASDAARSIGTRQYPQAAADVAGMALGAIPIAGPALKGAGKKVVKEGVEAATRLAAKYGADLNAPLRTAAPPSIVRSAPTPAEYIEKGSEKHTYAEPSTGSHMSIVTRPTGPRSASVIDLQVPEEHRGAGIGKALQAAVLKDFPSLGGQVSSKAAAKNAYTAGRRMAGNEGASLDDIYKAIDENSSVNLWTPTVEDLASKYGAEAPKTVVYHSGPKKFEQFDSSKLGKGFGSMFGLGHYTAEGEGARDFWREQIAKQGKKPHTYEIAVNANPEDFLHWQEPMSNQSETVKAAMDEISKEIAATQNAARDSLKARGTTAFGKPLTPDKLEELSRIAESGDVTGQQIYRYFQNKFGASGPDDKGAEVAKALLEKNIPGVRYVAPTRPGMDPRLAGSKNLVIFDDKIMDILKRYGLAPIMAGAAYGAAQQNPSDPNELDITKARGGVVNSADLRYKYDIK